MNDDFYTKAAELTRAGVPFATATVVRAEAPTSGKPGDKAIITADGALFGWIGGSCAQPTVIREALKALQQEASCLIRLSPDPLSQPPRPGLLDVPLTCFSGGTLEIFIEPQPPQPQLLIVGGLPVARALAQLAQTMRYRVTLVDPEHSGPPPPYADALLTDLTALAAQASALSAVVVATHGQYDELALEQALNTPAWYVGLVASRARAAAVREYLRDQGLSDAQLQRLQAPAGIDIRARSGDEIALSIMAEIVRQRRANPGIALAVPPEKAQIAPQTAIDPVCQMHVEIATARYTYEHGGATYYFCCPGCKTAFRKAPEQYLTPAQVNA